MNFQDATRHFLARFKKQETPVNPEEETPVEETQEAADSPPAEETAEEAPAEEIPATPVAESAPVPTLDEQIASGAAAVQDAVSAFRASKTADLDAAVTLTTARAEAQRIVAEAEAKVAAADGAEADALTEANAAIDAQVANLNNLKAAINA